LHLSYHILKVRIKCLAVNVTWPEVLEGKRGLYPPKLNDGAKKVTLPGHCPGRVTIHLC